MVLERLNQIKDLRVDVAAVQTNIVSMLVTKLTWMTIYSFAMHSGLEGLWLEL